MSLQGQALRLYYVQATLSEIHSLLLLPLDHVGSKTGTLSSCFSIMSACRVPCFPYDDNGLNAKPLKLKPVKCFLILLYLAFTTDRFLTELEAGLLATMNSWSLGFNPLVSTFPALVSGILPRLPFSIGVGILSHVCLHFP